MTDPRALLVSSPDGTTLLALGENASDGWEVLVGEPARALRMAPLVRGAGWSGNPWEVTERSARDAGWTVLRPGSFPFIPGPDPLPADMTV